MKPEQILILREALLGLLPPRMENYNPKKIPDWQADFDTIADFYSKTGWESCRERIEKKLYRHRNRAGICKPRAGKNKKYASKTPLTLPVGKG